MIKDKRILITGGRGFIGSALARRLAPDNAYSLFDISWGDDVLDKKQVASAVVGSQIIIHAAARVGVREVLEDTIATLQVNYTGTANVLQSALDTDCLERVVCFSTSEIFGVGADKVAEHGTPVFPDATDPRWCYGIGKLAAEHLALGYHKQYGLPITIVRPFNVFGEGRTGNHALLHFIGSALKGEDLMVYGDGSQVRAWCHIDDFCDAVIRMLDSKDAIGKAFNIGNPANVISVLGLAEKVIQLCGSKSKVVFKPLPFMDILVRIPDIGLARRVLEFEPKVRLEEGLERTIEWVRSNR